MWGDGILGLDEGVFWGGKRGRKSRKFRCLGVAESFRLSRLSIEVDIRQ